MKGLSKKMNLDELRAFKKAFEKKACESIVTVPQLYSEQKTHSPKQNTEFKI